MVTGTIDAVFTSLYDENDRLLSEQADSDNNGTIDQTTTFGYTGTQQTSKSVTDNATSLTTQSTTFTYNLQGRMANVVIDSFDSSGAKTSSDSISYEYDPDGIRISALQEIDSNADGTFESRTRTQYLIDNSNQTGYEQVLEETITDADTAALQKKVVYTIGYQQITQTTFTPGGPTEGQTLVFHYDGHGSTRILTDLAAATLQMFTYDAYGQLLAIHNATGQFVSGSASAALTSYLYSGEQFDPRIAQQYLRARYYNPTTGRFNRLDPFAGNPQDPQSLHKYLYTHADPVNGIDPTGELLGLALLFGRFFAGATRARTLLNAGSALVSLVNVGVWGLRTYFDNITNEGPVAGKPPDALVYSISFQNASPLNLLGGIGPGLLNASLGPVVNLDWLVFRDNPQWTYFYIAPGINLGTVGASVSFELGGVWDVDVPKDYEGPFNITSVAFVPGFLEDIEGVSATVFYDPTDLWEGAYGASALNGFGSLGLGYYTAWTRYKLETTIPTWIFLQQFLGAAGIAQFQRLLQQPNGRDIRAFVQQHGGDIVNGLIP